MDERNVTIGAGPFQPPTPNELRDITNELNTLKAEHASVRGSLREARAILSVDTADDLSTLLHRVLSEAGSVSVGTDVDGDLTITVEGLTLSPDDEIIQPEREFEVSTTITFEHRATIKAKDRDTAHDLYSEAVRDQLYDVDLDIRGEFVEDQDTYEAEFDYINVNEL